MRSATVALLGVSVLVVVVAIGIIVMVSSSGDTAIVDLDVGTCFVLPADDAPTVDRVSTLDCDDPHLAEVVAVGELNRDDRAYPTDDLELFAEVERACRSDADGVSDRFGLLPIAPTRELWESFAGRYLCVAIPYGGEPVTGSIARP